MNRHPSPRRLQRWLDTGETRRVDRHVTECDLCQSILDSLTELDQKVVADLQTVITAPADLDDRTNVGVDVRLRSEAATAVFTDLFLVAWDVAHTILDPITDSYRAQPEPTDTDGSI